MNRILRNINFWAAVIITILPLFFPEDLFRILSLAGIYSIASLGMCLLLGYTGQISLGQAAFAGIGAYSTALATTLLKWPSLIAFFSAIVISSIIAFVIGKPILKTKGYFLALATLGFGEIFYAFVSRTDPILRGFYGIGGVPYFSIAGYEFSSYIQMFYINWGILLGLLLFSQNMVNSRVGRALSAINTDEVAASAMGIDVASFKLKIFILSGAYGGIAGSLLANYVSTAQPHAFTVSFSIFVVLAVVVGGMGNIWGCILATVVLTWLKEEKLSQYQEYSTLIFGIILILIFIFSPKGLGPLIKRFASVARIEIIGQKISLIFKKVRL
jgi:branched-chain amino acid transport system permease protein